MKIKKKDVHEDSLKDSELKTDIENSKSDSKKSKKSRKKDSPTTRSKKATISITSCVCVAALACGIGLGVVFFDKFHMDVVDYSKIDPMKLEDSISKLMDRYADSNGNYDNFKPYELVNIGYEKFSQTENHYCVATGYAKAPPENQIIYSVSIREGDKLFNESLSTGKFMSLGKRFYQEGGNVTTYSTKKVVSGVGGVWNENDKTSYTLEEYSEAYGRTLDRTSIYVVSSKTVLDKGNKVDKINGGYKVTLNLDPILSVVRYVHQMESLSDLDGLPTFHNVSMEVTMDDELNIIHRHVKESYTVSKFGIHDTNSELDEYYITSECPIPALNTNFDYGGNLK